MPTRAISLGITIVLFLAAALPVAAWADERDKVKITGIIVSLNHADGSFQLQEFGDRGPRWMVLLHREVEVEDEKDDKRARGLRAGDIVEVKGRILSSRTILAKEIKILGHSGGQFPPVVPQPNQPPAPAHPPNTLAAIIKTLGVGAAVRAFAPALNSFINTLLQNKGAAVQAQTKVVPILSITIGISSPGSAYVGAAQVSGPPTALQRVEAVAVIEADYQGAFRIKALVPVDNLKPWEAFRRVPGVGVSAILDLRI